MAKETIEEKANKTKAKIIDSKKVRIAFDILALFCIILFCISITPKEFQNDTFYTIKVGQLIRTNGIDYKDHFSWQENGNLPYMYPHWLYDVITSLIFDFLGGFSALYITTMILSAILGVSLYYTTNKICQNRVISFAMTIGQMYIMRDYVAARAQLVTFILFVLTVLFIEKYLAKPKKRYIAALIAIPIAIANIHSAVFPFYFVLYLPYIGEYIIAVLISWHLPHNIHQWYINKSIKITNQELKKASKENATRYQARLVKLNQGLKKSNEQYEKFLINQKERNKNPYKLKIEKNDNTLGLIIIMLVCIFTGFLTPIKDMPYTYTWRIMQGNTTSKINEHLPLTLINNKPILYALTLFIGLLAFTKVKIKLRDLFFIGGLTLLAFMTRRQVSMLALFGGMVVARMVSDLLEKYDPNGTKEFMNYITGTLGEVLTILLILSFSYVMYKPIMNENYIDSSSYPVEACTWIKENLDYKNIKIFNDYNYGSYMLYEDIPVFIDSRCDLYTPEFNGTYDKNKKKFIGKDIFSDFLNISDISSYYDSKFAEYGVTHIITKSNSKLNMLIEKDDGYKQIYKDNKFVIYEREEANNQLVEED